MAEDLMLREIHEQPGAIAATVAAGREQIEALAARLRREEIQQVLVAARGTSDNAATYARYLLGLTQGLVVASAAPSLTTVYHAPLRLQRTLVLGISQSGRATDVLEVLEAARRLGAITAALTNTAESPLCQVAEYTLLTHARDERSVPATKTYTTALAVVHQLAAAWAGRAEMAEQIYRVPESIPAVFALEPQIQDRSERYRYMEHCAVISRGLNYCTAQETALKLQECCYVVPEALSSADLLHGPIASLAPGFPCFLFAPSGKALPCLQQLSEALAARQAEQIVISDVPEMVARGRVGFQLPGPLPEELSPLVAVVVGQLLAFYLAKHKGLNPDEPRGLRKVTLTR